MLGDIITIIILSVSVETVRSDYVKGSVSAARLVKIAEIDTSIAAGVFVCGSRSVFTVYRRQREQLIVAVIDGLCRIALRI
jgi:hypothetical protein